MGLTAAGVVSFGFSVWAYNVAAGPDHAGMGELLFPTELVTPQQVVRVQPRAWEFRAPYQSDLSPDSARAVDQLYNQLMREYPSCSPATMRATGRQCYAR